jgi:hypothetical protein
LGLPVIRITAENLISRSLLGCRMSDIQIDTQAETSTMISLRRSAFSFFLPLVGLLVASCSDGAVDPGKLLAPASANRDGKVGSTGNSAKSGAIDVRVLLDSKGGAFVEFRTGTFSDVTGLPAKPATADGYFTKIQYKVNNASGKQIFVRNITFSKTGVGYYTEPLNLCGASDENDDDDKGSSCSIKYDKGFTVVTQANLKGVGGDGNATDVVRDENAPEFSLGDVKLSDQPVYLLSGTTRTSLATAAVPLGLQTYQVDFPNLAAPAPAAGVQTQCLVYLDGSWLPQIPSIGSYVNANGFAYVGSSSPFVGAGHTETCRFTLNLTGTHKIVVTAVPLYPGDYNPLNNSTASFSVTPAAPSGPLSISLGAIQRLVGSPGVATPLGDVAVGITGQFTLPVIATGVIPAGTTVTCTISLLRPAGSTSPLPTPVSASLAPSAPSSACLFAFAFDVTGVYTFTVVETSPGQPTNTVTGMVNVLSAPPTADLYVSQFLQQDLTPAANFVPMTSVHVGVPTQYMAMIAMQGANVAGVSAMCTVKNGATTLATVTVQVTVNAAKCPFSFTATNSADGPQTFTVSITGQSVTDSVASNNTATGTVQALMRADVKAMIVDQSATLGKATQITMTVQNLEPVGGTPSTVVCALGWRLPAPAVMPAGAFTQSASPTLTVNAGETKTCTFTVTFTLAAGSIGVATPTVTATATPTQTSAQDDALANNTATATVTTNTGGAFTNTVAAMSTSQQWTVPPTGVLKVIGLQTQEVKVDRLALLVLPVEDTLGYFELTGTISSSATMNSADVALPLGPGMTFESGRAFGKVPRDQCLSPGGVFVDTAHPQNSVSSHVSVSAAICARAADPSKYPGMQEIVVSYTRTLPTDAAIGGPNSTTMLPDPLWAKTVSVGVVLSYRLRSQPASAPLTTVTATVTFNLKDAVPGDLYYASIWTSDGPFTTSIKSP